MEDPWKRTSLDTTLSLVSTIRRAATTQNESQEENGHFNAFKMNRQRTFYTALRYVSPSITNVFIVKAKGKLKECIKMKPQEKMFGEILRIWLQKRKRQTMKQKIPIC